MAGITFETMTFKKFIKQKYGTLKDFAQAHGVSVPTAQKYSVDPCSMSVKLFYQIAVKCDISVYALHDIVTQSYE